MDVKLTAGKFLIGFVLFFVYFAVIYGFAVKFGKTPISKRKERCKQDILYKFIVFSPIVILFIYIQDNWNLIILVAVITLFYEFVIQRPRLSRYIAQSEELYKTLKLKSQDEQYSFYAEKATIVLHRDIPKYIRGNLYDLQIDRVCKNEYGEYFWVKASLREFFLPSIKLLTLDGAKNLLRIDKQSYQQEFNEKPYYKSK